MLTVPATDNKKFLLERILKNTAGSLNREETERLSFLNREKVALPVIFVGTGTCGRIAGADGTLRAVKDYLADHQLIAEVVETGCTGLCSEEPLLDVQLPGKARLSFRKVTSAKVDDILTSVFNRSVSTESVLAQYNHGKLELWPNVPLMGQLPFFSLQTRNLLKNAGMISFSSIDEYLAQGGYRSFHKTIIGYTPEKVCTLVEQSELRGRGGGGFPTGKKWLVALNTAGDQKHLICNAEESDPGAFMDRAIIEGDPHRLLEGIAIASYAIGASHAVIYLRSDYPMALNTLQNAINQAKEYEILGQNIFGSGFNLSITIRESAGAFVCGEETALISSLEGRRGVPTAKPPYPAESGLFHQPTIVNNVETLANIPAILENGPLWFKKTGTAGSKGTKLFSIAGHIRNSGFIEVPMGIKLSEIIYSIGEGIRDDKKLKAVQIGGPSGVCIPADKLDVEIGYESLSDVDAVLGSGGLVVFDETVCMVSMTRYFMEFLQNESCGKCIPCREGTRRMLEILNAITRRPKEDITHDTLERFKGVVQLETLATVLKDTSLCGLGQNAPNPVMSSLTWFREEFEEHIFDRHCSTGTCRDLRRFYINVDNCNGCNVCLKKCPEKAIIGVIKNPHFIVEEKCNGCGICYESCKFNAIILR